MDLKLVHFPASEEAVFNLIWKAAFGSEKKPD